MKKILLSSVAALVLLLGVTYGPDLVDLYRLQAFITESAAREAAAKGPWPNLITECEGCHGLNGSSLHQGYPSLAGQPTEYLEGQLRAFTSAERENPMMVPLAMTLTPDNIRDLSAYFAKQAASSNEFFRADPVLVRKGGEIVARGNCVTCHGPELAGAHQFPRLAGQSYDYVLKQLNDFAAGTRRDPTRNMNQLAAGWSQEDREAVATYLASHPVARSAQP